MRSVDLQQLEILGWPQVRERFQVFFHQKNYWLVTCGQPKIGGKRKQCFPIRPLFTLKHSYLVCWMVELLDRRLSKFWSKNIETDEMGKKKRKSEISS
jgi:hypothetical protein